jgi:hypothetical protein
VELSGEVIQVSHPEFPSHRRNGSHQPRRSRASPSLNTFAFRLRRNCLTGQALCMWLTWARFDAGRAIPPIPLYPHGAAFRSSFFLAVASLNR